MLPVRGDRTPPDRRIRPARGPVDGLDGGQQTKTSQDTGQAAADLGTRWEMETACPLPLGGIVASRQLPAETIAVVQRVIHDSLALALHDRDAALPTMRTHAQEFDDRVLMQHVDLYVNDWTIDLGPTGARALDELSARAASLGLAGGRLEVFAG